MSKYFYAPSLLGLESISFSHIKVNDGSSNIKIRFEESIFQLIEHSLKRNHNSRMTCECF